METMLEPLAQLRELYTQGQYLQAFRAGEAALGPLRKWPSPAGRVLAGYAQQARAFELDPLDPMLAAFHGYNVWSKVSKDDGRKVLDDAFVRYPNNVFVWYMRLNTSALDGDFDKAAELREDGLRLLPHLMQSPIYLAGKMMQDVMAARINPTLTKIAFALHHDSSRPPEERLEAAAGMSAALLGCITTLPNYRPDVPLARMPEYYRFLDDLQDSVLALQVSALESDLEGARHWFRHVKQSCTACHARFRASGEP